MLRRLLTALALLAVTGCSAPRPPAANPEAPYPPPRPPAVGDILHLPTGYYVSEAQMLAAAGDVRIVYVGETHDNPASHRLQLRVLEALAERHPGRVALGMEMFTPAQQEALDRWVAGELTEKEFLRAARWYDQWKMDFAYYRDLLLFARHRQIPVLGLNAAKETVRAVGRKAPEELSDDERRALPEMDLSDPYQRTLVEAIFGGHDAGNGRLDGFQRVQTLWDETMAENIARYLGSPQGEEMHLMVIAGGNHIRHGFGIPRRVFRRLPLSYALLGSKELVVAQDKQDRLMDVTIPRFPMPAYDYLAFTDYEDLEKKPVRLGVLLEEREGRVTATAVLPGSAAEQAGIAAGDVLAAFDGQPVAESFDVIYAVQQKSPGEGAVLLIERDGETREVTVSFEAAAE